MYALKLCVIVWCIGLAVSAAVSCSFHCRRRSCDVRGNCDGSYIWRGAQARATIGGTLTERMMITLPMTVDSVKLLRKQHVDVCSHIDFQLDTLAIFTRGQGKLICNNSAVPLTTSEPASAAEPPSTPPTTSEPASAAEPPPTPHTTSEPASAAEPPSTMSSVVTITTTEPTEYTTTTNDHEDLGRTMTPPDDHTTTHTASHTTPYTATIALLAAAHVEELTDSDDILVISISVPSSLIVLIVIAIRVYYKFRHNNDNDSENDIELRHIELSPVSTVPSPAAPAPPTPPPLHQPAQPKNAKHEPPSTPPPPRRSRRIRREPDRWSPTL